MPDPRGRTVSAEYQKGLLSKLPGYIDQPISYHANGMFWQRRHANGMRVDQHIDSTTMMTRPQQLNVFDVNNTALSYSGIYDYDGSGNIKAMGGARRYRYDGVSRMVESQETWGTTTYIQRPTFDGYGNIQSMETGPSGSLTTLNTPTSASTNRLTSAGTVYDPVGNMTSWNGGAQYDYDRLNRMRRFRGSPTPGSEEWVFAYTAGDERILSLRVGGSGRIWSLRGLDGTLLREWRSESSVQSFKEYVWNVRHLVAKVERTPSGGSYTESTIHAATDHLGTVRTYTNSAGLALPGHIYYPFGQQLNGTQDGERIKYTGHERDLWNTPSTADDLDYMHARHYNPQIGRLLQIDPLPGSSGAPQTLNRYSYVAGNPLSRIDPTGLKMCFYGHWTGYWDSGGTGPGGALVGKTDPELLWCSSDPTGGGPGDDGIPRGPEGPGRIPEGPGDDPNDDPTDNPDDPDEDDDEFDSVDWAHCVQRNRADVLLAAAIPLNPVPKSALGYSSRRISGASPYTTLISAGAHEAWKAGWLSIASRNALRSVGRVAARAAVPLTLAEGAWDIYAMVSCAF